MPASGVGSKVWVLTIGVLEVNPERDAREARFLVESDFKRHVTFGSDVDCWYYLKLSGKYDLPFLHK